MTISPNRVKINLFLSLSQNNNQRSVTGPSTMLSGSTGEAELPTPPPLDVIELLLPSIDRSCVTNISSLAIQMIINNDK